MTTNETVNGKSTGKGVTVAFQGITVVAILKMLGVEDETIILYSPLITAAVHMVQKFFLHYVGWNLKIPFGELPGIGKILPVLLLLPVMGCNTLGGSVNTQFSETVTDPNTGIVTTTTHSAESKAGMFGKLDTTNQTMAYEWKDGEGDIQVGQSGEGYDNSGNVEGMKAIAEAVGNSFGAAMENMGKLIESMGSEPDAIVLPSEE